MSRLTHRNENGEARVWLYSDPKNMARVLDEQSRKEVEVLEKLAHYEDLEEDGRLIELPCKIGDTLYDITDFVEHCHSPEIYEVHASWISFSTDKSGELWIDIGGFDYRLDDFGKSVFLTKAEAEAKLAELQSLPTLPILHGNVAPTSKEEAMKRFGLKDKMEDLKGE